MPQYREKNQIFMVFGACVGHWGEIFLYMPRIVLMQSDIQKNIFFNALILVYPG